MNRHRIGALAGLGVALAAGAALLASPDSDGPAPSAGRVGEAAAWPHAQRADIPGNLPDGPLYNPGLFLDARASVGTAPTPDGTAERLVIQAADGTVRELRRLPFADGPHFENLTVAGDQVVWTESTEKSRLTIWAAGVSGGAARRLTGDTGEAVFYGSQYDLVAADGRVHWAAAGAGSEPVTEIRSVALTGGTVEVRTEKGTWALTAWPWVVNGFAGQSGSTSLRNLATGRDSTVSTTGGELVTCSPVWCRAMVVAPGGELVRIDVLHPDGSGRRQVAGSAASAAIVDVAPLDRFEVFSEAGPDSDLTGSAPLLVYDLAADRTVDIAADVNGAFYRAGVLWWVTGDQDSTVWHTIDLRTI